MTYQEALDWIYHFSDFERGGTFQQDDEHAGLHRMAALLDLLGTPQAAYTTTHIAGTKGKGSTAVLVASALRASGIRTGLYTQPDLHTFRERIQIDGMPISEADIATLVPIVRDAVDRLDLAMASRLITFEIGTALALLAFARKGVSHAVIEVGLGGRLDPTNVIAPLVGIITSISLDHQAILGDTIAAIAREKAGIIKAGMTVITSAQHPDALAVIQQTCLDRGAHCITVGPSDTHADYRYTTVQRALPIGPDDPLTGEPLDIMTPHEQRSYLIGLLGGHQRQNATAAVAALDALKGWGIPVNADGIAAGLQSARWPARFDVVGRRPWIVIDGAHNDDSLARLMEALSATLQFKRMWIIYGTLRDKNIDLMGAVLHQNPSIAGIIPVPVLSPRARDPREVAASLNGLPVVYIARSVDDAFTYALDSAQSDDLICATGSLYLAAEAIRWVKDHRDDPLAQAISIDGRDHG